jgi:hypothetical protein
VVTYPPKTDLSSNTAGKNQKEGNRIVHLQSSIYLAVAQKNE